MSTVGSLDGSEPTHLVSSVETVVKRQVIRASEYNEVAIPLELVVRDGRLDIYSELTSSNVLRTYSKDGQLLLQAGGLVGYIPLNDRLAIEIEPRVPIGNLERMLLLAGSSAPVLLANHLSRFTSSPVGLPNSLLDVLAGRLAALTEACWNEGLYAEYQRAVNVGHSPRGRLDLYATVQRRLKRNDRLATASEQFRRTHDVAPNRCLAAALERFYEVYSGMRDRAGGRAMAARVHRARQLLGTVSTTTLSGFERHPLVLDPSRFPASRPSYSAAVSLAKVVLSGEGIELRSRAGHITLPPMMIRMETVFESYLRAVLSDYGEMVTLDGNKAPPDGAKATLFHSAPRTSSHRRVRSTPDIVLRERTPSERRVVIDAKYKLDVSRDDVNQVLGYALTYGTDTVALVLPRKSAAAPRGLQLLGQVGGVSVYTYVFDLGSPDLEAEEQLFRVHAGNLLAAATTLANDQRGL